MRVITSYLFVLPLMVALTPPVSAQRAFPPSGLDAYVDQVMRTFDVPGVALSIVKDGHVVLAKGYGVRERGELEPVSSATLFPIASNTKAFTATALGMLVDEGKLAWDTPVIDYVPWFRLSDPYVTSEITIRDLLVHRSGLGLGAGDLLLFPQSDYSRREVVQRLKDVPLATSFRSAYAYDNVLYLAAAEVIEAVSGMPWESFVQTRLLDTLGMTSAKADAADGYRSTNVAAPHARVDGIIRKIRPFIIPSANSSGGILAGADDMARWMMTQLDSGRVSGRQRLYSAQIARELWTLVTPMPIGNPRPGLEPLRSSFRGYALGWFVRDYRGMKLVWHNGGMPGHVSLVLMIPDKKIGVTVLTNQESSEAFFAIGYHLLDYFLDAPKHDWLAAYVAGRAAIDSSVAAAEQSARLVRDSLSEPSRPLDAYAGTYRDQWYGDIVVEHGTDGHLTIRFTHTPALTGDLVHWQHDTFVARWRDRSLRADAFVTFVLMPDGRIDEMRLLPASPAVDFSYDFQDLRPRRVAP